MLYTYLLMVIQIDNGMFASCWGLILKFIIESRETFR